MLHFAVCNFQGHSTNEDPSGACTWGRVKSDAGTGPALSTLGRKGRGDALLRQEDDAAIMREWLTELSVET